MKTVFEIKCSVDDIGRTFLGFPEDTDGNYIYIAVNDNPGDLARAAEISGLSEVAIKSIVAALADLAEEVESNVREDLKAIWERLDRMEGKQ